MIPSGQTTARYQLSVEALDPNWSTGVGAVRADSG